jgi:hypothetical protein
MKRSIAVIVAAIMLLGLTGTAAALPVVQIFYDLQYLGQNQDDTYRWQYNYTVVNNSLGTYSYNSWCGQPCTIQETGITYFEIFYPEYAAQSTPESSKFKNLLLTGVPDTAKWDAFVWGPTSVDPKGHHPPWPIWKLDAYATNPANLYQEIYPILEGHSAAGFSVAFDYTDSGTPGSQKFIINRLDDLVPVFSGDTEPKPVPEPASLFLLMFGMVILACRRLFALRDCSSLVGTLSRRSRPRQD